MCPLVDKVEVCPLGDEGEVCPLVDEGGRGRVGED